VSHFYNNAIADGDTVDLVSSDTFLEWVRVRNRHLADTLPKSPNDYFTDLLRVQVMDPLTDLNMINDPSDSWYAMTQEGLGRLFNEIYNIYWGEFNGDDDKLIANWKDSKYSPLNLKIQPVTVYLVVASIDKPDSINYVLDSLGTKGERFKNQISWFKYCTDFNSLDYTKKAGPKDDLYRRQTALMKIIKGYGCTPVYRFADSGKKVTGLSEFFLQPPSVLKKEYETRGARGWLAVQHHENPDADFSGQFTYEKLLKDYLEDLRRIDQDLTPVVRFDQAKRIAEKTISDGQSKIRALNTRNIVQMVVTVLFALVPALLLTALLILAIIENPVVDTSNLDMSYFFWPVGIIFGIIFLSVSDKRKGCVAAMVAGCIVSFILTATIWYLGQFILYIYLLVVLWVTIPLSIKTLFSPSHYAKTARKFSKPGFDELVLEPLYHAFSNDSVFDSSTSLAFNENDIENWKGDLKKRRIYVILFVCFMVILSGLSIFVPKSSMFNKVKHPATEQVVTEVNPDLQQFQSLNPGDVGANVDATGTVDGSTIQEINKLASKVTK
ncbi:MAG: hypothetical protein ACI39U_03920, partial [Candidatus Cryptobacteroides sp.]